MKDRKKLKVSDRGVWVKRSPANIYECDNCGQTVMTEDIKSYKYCHGCGVQMRVESK